MTARGTVCGQSEVKKWILLLIGCIAAVLAIIFLPDRAPLGNAAAVYGSFLYYSNDASGSRMAVFRISNHSQLPIRRERYYQIDIRDDAGWTNLPTMYLRSTSPRPVVRPTQSEIFSIAVPVAGRRWRLCYPYEEHQSWIRRVRLKLGLPSKHQPGSYAGFTDAVGP
jgi:hypothetical protein